MASKVTPSTPGAPSFCLASAYASRSVSILQTWTYNPQKRQDFSAFALTYILLLRSCKFTDGEAAKDDAAQQRHQSARHPSRHQDLADSGRRMGRDCRRPRVNSSRAVRLNH